MNSETDDIREARDISTPRVPQTGRNVRLIAFYLGVPVVVAIYGALNNWTLLASTGYPSTLAFYAAHALIPWWMTCLSTSLAMWGLRSVKPPPVVLMAIGALVGGFIALPYSNWLTGLFSGMWQDASLSQELAPLFSMEFWRYIIRATIVWFAINFAFDRFLGLPRYRYVIPRGYDFHDRPRDPGSDSTNHTEEGSADEQAARSLPGFADRIPAALTPDDILAVKAEQHYIRVYTPTQEYMVLYRFSDALRDLEPERGLQVHRSYWISKTAIDMIRPSAKKFSIRLKTGTSIPVSTPYHGIVREFARANQIPVR
jgi:hypothetical protein